MWNSGFPLSKICETVVSPNTITATSKAVLMGIKSSKYCLKYENVSELRLTMRRSVVFQQYIALRYVLHVVLG